MSPGVIIQQPCGHAAQHVGRTKIQNYATRTAPWLVQMPSIASAPTTTTPKLARTTPSSYAAHHVKLGKKDRLPGQARTPSTEPCPIPALLGGVCALAGDHSAPCHHACAGASPVQTASTTSFIERHRVSRPSSTFRPGIVGLHTSSRARNRTSIRSARRACKCKSHPVTPLLIPSHQSSPFAARYDLHSFALHFRAVFPSFNRSSRKAVTIADRSRCSYTSPSFSSPLSAT